MEIKESVLVVGVGAVGSEVLLQLSRLPNPPNITIIDNDTIDASNLHRQILFTSTDTGKSKSATAALNIRKRASGITVEHVVGLVESQPVCWFEKFSCIISAVDSLVTRRWLNMLFISTLVTKSEQSRFIVCGIEGWMGSVQLIDKQSACLECIIDLYTPIASESMASCSNRGKPRDYKDVLSFILAIDFEREFKNNPFDIHDQNHIDFVSRLCMERCKEMDLQVPSEEMLLSRIHPIIPAIPATVCLVGALAVELACRPDDWASEGNFYFYNGKSNNHLTNHFLEKNPSCHICK